MRLETHRLEEIRGIAKLLNDLKSWSVIITDRPTTPTGSGPISERRARKANTSSRTRRRYRWQSCSTASAM